MSRRFLERAKSSFRTCLIEFRQNYESSSKGLFAYKIDGPSDGENEWSWIRDQLFIEDRLLLSKTVLSRFDRPTSGVKGQQYGEIFPVRSR